MQKLKSKVVDTQHILEFSLGSLGLIGTVTFLTLTGVVMWYHRGSRIGSFRWHWRNQRLKQITVLASLFFLAMAASYAVLHDVWVFMYLIAAFKTGTWWFRFFIGQRT